MELPLISVAIATFNGEKYIHEQLISIFSQTYKNIEVIVCDDNSTDNTFSILSEFKARQKLKLIKNKKNLGYIKNFEKALSLCNGEFIALSDQDDIWFSNKLEILLKNIGQKSLIWSDCAIIDKKGAVISQSFEKIRNLDLEANLDNKILFGSFILGCTVLFKKEVLKYAIPFPKSNPPHDWWICLVSSKINGIKYLPIPLIKWRRHEMTDTTPSSFQFKSKYFRIIKFIIFFKFSKDIVKFIKSIRKERKHYQYIYADLKSIELFNENDKKIIDELNIMFKSVNETRFKLRGFKILYKYRSLLFPEKNLLMMWGRLFLFCYS